MTPVEWHASVNASVGLYGTSRRRRNDVGNGLRPDRRLWDGLFRPTDVVCLQGT